MTPLNTAPADAAIYFRASGKVVLIVARFQGQRLVFPPLATLHGLLGFNML
eukprot:c11015_g1_i1 orf=101-253(-)